MDEQESWHILSLLDRPRRAGAESDERMSYLCPKDYKPCCDDLCHGGGCIRMNSYAMLLVCDVCKGIIDEEIPECSTCSCEHPDDDDW